MFAFLICTFSLKTYGLITDEFNGSVFPTWSQILASGWELVLAFWLLSGWKSNYSRWATILTFSAFAGLSMYLHSIGQASCGCFGKVEVSPLKTICLDLIIVLLCFVFDKQTGKLFAPNLSKIGVGVGVAYILVLLTVFSLYEPNVVFSKLKGKSLVLQPVNSNVGTAKVGTERAFEVELLNISDKPITIAGGTSVCGCTTIDDLPVTIQPNEKVKLAVKMNFKGSPGVFSKEYNFYSTAQERFTVGRFSGSVE